ncbi:sugar phosphate isomerase/epimerase family protein [Halosimplex salinum]|uniref:sugar phosphate isomerase/epimerase family protein n=1 Tax=Halosimplex salinum TaxID=1710538 RepID=UPI000F479449|nr:TIM barrel protein [Halosimplex salinum]
MYTSFGPAAVGVDLPFPDAAALAAEVGFDGIQTDLSFLDDSRPETYRAVLDEHDLRPGSANLPVDVTGDADAYEADLAALPAVAEAAAAVGCTRMSTYIMSFSDERPFEENVAFHRDRLAPVADVVADHGIDLGLEFLGPETLREGHEYEFVSTAEGMLDLCDAVGDNAGLLLDCWHWHTAGASAAALESLDADDVVDVHVNDAPEGLALDEYVDTERALPGATGVIDVESFLGRLDAIDYDGPVMAEPFSDELDAMDDAAAARETAQSLERVFDRAGV